MKTILSSYDISKYVAGCARKAGVSVVWEEGGSPRTDGDTVYLPYIDAYESPKNVCKLKNFVRHETAHITYSDFEVLKNNGPQGLLAFIDNLIEDHRVDYLNDTEFEGDKELTNEFFVHWLEEQKSTLDLSKVPAEHRDTMLSLFAWDYSLRCDTWAFEEAADFMAGAANPDVVAKLHKYDAEVRKVRTIENKVEGSGQVYELAKRILEEVFEIPPSSMEKPASGKSGEGGEGKDEGKGEGESEGKGKGKVGDGEEGEEGSCPDLVECDMEGRVASPYAPHSPEGGGVNAHNYECGDKSRSYVPDPPENIREFDFQTGRIKNMGAVSVSTMDYLQVGKHVEECVSMANVLRTKLQVYSRDRWEFGKKKGKLHSSALWRTTMKDATGYNERVFKQRLVNRNLDVCIQLLVDASGSMSGAKFENAAAAATALNETLSNVLHIPVEILAFTDHYGGRGFSGEARNTMFVLKNFDRSTNIDSLARAFTTVSHYLADNVDGESLVYGFNRIRGRKEKRRIMIVLSDGSPCGGHHKGSTITHTKEVIKAIENSGEVELMGIGIMYDAVRSYYKHYDTIPNAKSIEPSLIRILDKLLFRS